MKKYYIGGLLTLVTIAFATVTLAVNKDVIGYRRYIYTKAGSIVFVAFAIYIAVLSVGALVYAIYRHFHKDE